MIFLMPEYNEPKKSSVKHTPHELGVNSSTKTKYMKIDQEDFNRKAEHIIETVVKPQVKRYEKRMLKEKTIAIIGMFIVTAVIFIVMTLIVAWAFNRTY